MRANISDAPERVIRKHNKHNVFYTVICLMVGGISTIGALQLISRAPSHDSANKQTASPTGIQTGAGDMPPRQGLDSSQFRAPSEIRLPASTARQTVFNDQNFTPRGADNVIAFRVGSDPSQEKAAPNNAELTIVRQSPSIKERACWPYRHGSIESRNCRALIGLKHRD